VSPPPTRPPESPSLAEEIAEELAALEAAGLRRRIRTLAGSGPRARVEGRDVISFASNDYLGLAGDPRLAAALARGAAEEGAGAGAARLLAGSRPAHDALERDAAVFRGTEAALLFGSGYVANLSLIPALCGEGDLVVSDRLNHASLVDGCRLSRARVEVVPHGDEAAVRRALGRGGFRRRVVATEGLFSMEGDVAPLAEIVAAAREHGALVVLDDAHGNGVLGATGRGALEAAGLGPSEDLVQMGTFGKAFGGYGAFVAWTRDGIDLLLHRARGFVFSTALPPGVAAMDREGLAIAAREPWRRERVLALAARLRAGLRAAGLEPGDGPGPIVPVLLGRAEDAVRASERLMACGFFAPALRPPTVPRGTSRLRLSLSAAHREEDVDGLVAAAREAVRG
jgi:8-amino-7-oxononanoate synthase